MKQAITSICFLLLTCCVNCQIVHVVKGSTEKAKNKTAGFTFIQDSLDKTRPNFVATLKVTGMDLRATLPELYFMIKHKANFLGANSFKAINYNERANTLQLDVYFLTDSAERENEAFVEKNCIYLFAREKSSSKNTSFKLNGEERSLPGGQYYKHILKEQEEVKIEKGGALGSKVQIKWAAGKPASFIGMEGFKVFDPGSNHTNSSSVGISPGGLVQIESGLGNLLIRVLKPAHSPAVEK